MLAISPQKPEELIFLIIYLKLSLSSMFIFRDLPG